MSEDKKVPTFLKEPLEETPKVTSKKETPSASPTVLLSSADAYVYERMKSQPKSLDEVDVKVEEKIVPGQHRLSLPNEIKAFEKKYAFKWIFKRPQAISEACDLRGWVLANKTYFPELPNHLFTANGSIERGDSILAFMPQARAEILRRKPGELSRSAIKTRFDAHKDDPNYYVPKDEEDSKVVGI
jgi:hypothetical protein